ncbi:MULTISPECIES: hypothetical protein [unclassified Sphingobacterium]|nr:hypothetical protein [Sphingobacterium sp. UGAL515B_05]WON97148.1 hypothetical protein OK025_12235 [Sphingobacterium sp. UGAL515B_05]
MKEKSGFLLTPYDEQMPAKLHAHRLDINEGKLLQLPEDNQKIEKFMI